MPIVPERHQTMGLKRKINTSTSTRKKFKVQHHSLESLPWKSVSRPAETGLGGDDGILDLEEVDDVEVVYEQTDAGRVAKFNVRFAVEWLRDMTDAFSGSYFSIRKQ
jgi:ATP-dependent RNA helicase DDX24/MAK5